MVMVFMTEYITIDRKVRFGKPTIKDTRVTVDEVIGALAGDMSFEEIENEYGVTKEGILAALKYAAKVLTEEHVGSLAVSR